MWRENKEETHKLLTNIEITYPTNFSSKLSNTCAKKWIVIKMKLFMIIISTFLEIISTDTASI